MKVVKLIDYEGEEHFLNKKFIIAIRPFYHMKNDKIRKSKVEYGSGWMDCIYMKEPANAVASLIVGSYLR